MTRTVLRARVPHRLPGRAGRTASAKWLVLAALAGAASGRVALAQNPLPPVHGLGAVVARLNDSTPLAMPPNVVMGAGSRGFHVLSDGRVVVNQTLPGRIVIYDATLTHEQTVIDTTFGGKIFGYLADTSLLLDPTRRVLVVMDPRGALVRTIPLPTTNIEAAGTPLTSRVDSRGRIVYQTRKPRGAGAPTGLHPAPDSTLLLRVDVGTGVIDTVTTFAVFANPLGGDPLSRLLAGMTAPVPGTTQSVFVGDGTTYSSVFTVSVVGAGAATSTGRAAGAGPGGGGADSVHGGESAIFSKSLPTIAEEAGLTLAPPSDGWAVLSDGTIAVARGEERRIDWYAADGSHSASPTLSYGGVRLTDAAKTVLVDSLKRTYAAHPEPTQRPSAIPADMRVLLSAPIFPEPATLPDYLGGFGQVKADADGNLWLQEVADPTIWGVVNRQGQVVDRVQIPVTRSIEWFGPGVVYLTSALGAKTSLIEARIH